MLGLKNRFPSVLNLIFLLLSYLLLASCISVQIPTSSHTRSKNIRFRAPKPPFVSTDFTLADGVWTNPQNGNSISYLSECDGKTDPTLELVQQGILRGIQNLHIEYSEYKSFNSRKALITVASGEVDGIASKMKLVIFAKNQCLYTLTYVALGESFDSNLSSFQYFLDNFEAP